MQPLTIPLRPDGTTAVLNAPNPLTKKDLGNLKAWLNWYETSMGVEENGTDWTSGEDQETPEDDE